MDAHDFRKHTSGAGRVEQIVCPNCGEPIASLPRVKELIDFCKEFWGQCSCGQKYNLRASPPDGVVLSFVDTQLEVIF